jgi:hypothetical protein
VSDCNPVSFDNYGPNIPRGMEIVKKIVLEFLPPPDTN